VDTRATRREGSAEERLAQEEPEQCHLQAEEAQLPHTGAVVEEGPRLSPVEVEAEVAEQS
jgi:hypothetical protein